MITYEEGTNILGGPTKRLELIIDENHTIMFEKNNYKKVPPKINISCSWIKSDFHPKLYLDIDELVKNLKNMKN